jgi:hypothetical protein
MVTNRKKKSGDGTPPDGQTPTSIERRAPNVMRSIASSIERLQAENERLSVLAFAAQAGPSVAPQILEFATSDTANCSGGRSCARLYLALQGMVIPVGDTTTGMDMTCLNWWFRAMAEHATGRWGGNQQGVKAIAAAQPLIWEQAQAATNAWKKMKQEQDARFLFDGGEGADEE